MGKQSADKSGYVKAETMILAIGISLVIGFLAGVGVTVYKTGGGFSSGKGTAATGPVHDEMLQALEDDVARNPDNVAAWIQIGNLYFDRGESDKAIGAYEKALELSPDNPNVLTDLGVMYRRSGEPKKAIDAFDRAIAADPKHEVSRFNKGVVMLHDLNDREGALRAWEELLAVNPVAMAPNGQSVDELIKHYREHADE